MRRESVPMFPQFSPKPRDRVLCFLEKRTLYLEDGSKINVDSYRELVQEMYNRNLYVIVSDFFKCFPWLDDAIECFPSSKVQCSKYGEAKAIRIAFADKTTRWVVLSETWGWKSIPSLELLHNLRSFFNHMQVGVHNSPASLGFAHMRLMWSKYGLLRHTKANGYAQEYIKNHMIGGRVDTPGLGEYYDKADMLDMASAYLSKFDVQTTGTSVGFSYGDVEKFADYFALCKVRINSELPLGPFPVRNENGSIVYPTLKGVYYPYLWKVQVQDCINAGCTVVPENGYGWLSLTSDPFYWCSEIYQKKIEADLIGVDFLSSKVKASIVGAIGKHASGEIFYYIVPEEYASDVDLHVSANGESYNYYVHEERRQNDNMIHWYSDTISKCASELYRFALPYAERDELIATNYDSVITLERSENKLRVVKHTAESVTVRPGTWCYTALTNLYVQNARTFFCDQMSQAPGQSGKTLIESYKKYRRIKRERISYLQ